MLLVTKVILEMTFIKEVTFEMTFIKEVTHNWRLQVILELMFYGISGVTCTKGRNLICNQKC